MIGSILVDIALRRSRQLAGPLPRCVEEQAVALWWHMTTRSLVGEAPFLALDVPSMALVADGAVNLAREQAARGIRTIAPVHDTLT